MHTGPERRFVSKADRGSAHEQENGLPTRSLLNTGGETYGKKGLL